MKKLLVLLVMVPVFFAGFAWAEVNATDSASKIAKVTVEDVVGNLQNDVNGIKTDVIEIKDDVNQIRNKVLEKEIAAQKAAEEKAKKEKEEKKKAFIVKARRKLSEIIARLEKINEGVIGNKKDLELIDQRDFGYLSDIINGQIVTAGNIDEILAYLKAGAALSDDKIVTDDRLNVANFDVVEYVSPLSREKKTTGFHLDLGEKSTGSCVFPKIPITEIVHWLAGIRPLSWLFK